jgi:hypothetical protein
LTSRTRLPCPNFDGDGLDEIGVYREACLGGFGDKLDRKVNWMISSFHGATDWTDTR